MDDFYRITVCSNALVDSDIPLLERTMNKYLGISSEAFYQAFKEADELCFTHEICVDVLQECMLLMEDQGFVVTASKTVKPSIAPELITPSDLNKTHSLDHLTYDDCHVLFSGNSNSINKWIKHKNWIVFGCSIAVVSSYLIMIYSSFI